MLAAGAASVVPAEAAPAEQAEDHRFAPENGKSAGFSAHLSGDYAIYTSRLGGEVQIAHRVGPGADDWDVAILAAPAADPRFGAGVRLDEDADRAFVGAPNTPAVYVYARSGGNSWTLDATLTPAAFPARVTGLAGFGESLDVHGDRLAVGVPNATVDGKSNAGFAYVIDLTSNTWTPLIPAEPFDSSITGQSVAVDGDHVAVSAVQHRDSRHLRVGGVYLWGDPAVEPLFTSQPDSPRVCLDLPGNGVAFGLSIVLADGVLYVGSPLEINYTGDDPESAVDGCTETAVSAGKTTQGAVYRFDADLTQIGPKLVPPAGSYAFGTSIATDGDTLLASTTNGQDAVRVYDVNDLTSGTGDVNRRERIEPVATLVASDGGSGSSFGQYVNGQSVSVSGGRALVAAPGARARAGTVYVFESPAPEVALALEDVEIAYGQPARLTATVSDPALTGSVEFSVDAGKLPPVRVSQGKAGLALPTGSHGAGEHPLAAVLFGGGELLASDEATLTVARSATTTTVTARPMASAGGRVSVTGSVTARYGTVPTGSVTIVVDGTTVGWATLDAAGAYRWAPAARTAPAASVRAEYAGDANHLASAAGSTVETVAPPAPTGSPSAPSGSLSATAGTSGKLPTTGAPTLQLVALAVALLLGGAGAWALRLRRQG